MRFHQVRQRWNMSKFRTGSSRQQCWQSVARSNRSRFTIGRPNAYRCSVSNHIIDKRDAGDAAQAALLACQFYAYLDFGISLFAMFPFELICALDFFQDLSRSQIGPRLWCISNRHSSQKYRTAYAYFYKYITRPATNEK